MAIEKDHDGNALKRNFGYWRYAGVLRVVTDLVIAFYDEKQPGFIIKLEGYDSIEHRELVKQGVAQCEFFHEFAICNWREVKQETRPATVAEKKKLYQERAVSVPGFQVPDLTDEQWQELPYDILLSEEIIEHNDYDRFAAAVGTKDEAAVAYDIFKTHKFSADFAAGGVDV